MRCNHDLKKGQFVDTYRGEIITHDEANRRGETGTLNRDNYLLQLDKFAEQSDRDPYVCDGMYMGGPTRFINHSCEPNCRLFTVSYNHADINMYDLAFFTVERIPAGTELTFDYLDEDDRTLITDKMADELTEMKGYRPSKCLCGTETCRGYFFN